MGKLGKFKIIGHINMDEEEKQEEHVCILKDTFTERYDIRKIKFLYNLKFTQFIELFNCDRDEENGKKWKTEEKKQYFNNLKSFFDKILVDGENCEDNGVCIQTRYIQTSGRYYVVGNGTQKIQREVKDFLYYTDEDEQFKSYDIDIVNCVPSILLYIAKKNGIKATHLKSYIREREFILEDQGLTKNDIIMVLNQDNPKIKNNWLSLLFDDIKRIREIILNKDEYNHIKPKPESDNPKSSRLSKIIYNIESEIINKCVKVDGRHSALCFDGWITYNQNPEQLLIDINKIVEEYHYIKFIIKPFKYDDIVFDKFVDFINSGAKCDNYIFKKIEFEKRFSYVHEQGIYIEKVKGEWKERGFDQFKMNSAPIIHTDKYGKKTDTFTTWRKDNDRKIFDRIVFLPYNIYDEEQVKKYSKDEKLINKFNGFDSIKLDNINNNEDQLIIDTFNNYIKEVIANNDEEITNHLIKFLQHLVQYPNELVEVVHVFKSLEGAGKDTLIELLKIMLGDRYVYITEDQQDIFGNFNESLENRLIVVFNEVSGVDSNKNKEKIKSLATAKQINIRKKYMNATIQESFLRLFFFSNNPKPVQVGSDSRRFCIIRNGWDRIGDSSYFENFRKICFTKHACNVIFTYLLNADIIGYSPRWDKPITEEEVKMKADNYNLLQYWLFQELDNVFNKEKYSLPKDDNIKIVKTTEFHTLFTNDLIDNLFDKKIIDDWKSRKKIASELTTRLDGFTKIKLHGIHCYKIEINKVKKYLSKVFRNHDKHQPEELNLNDDEITFLLSQQKTIAIDIESDED